MSESACPWTKLADVAQVEIAPFHGHVHHQLSIPGSKSISNRVLIMAAVADGITNLHGMLRSEDTYWTLQALRQLGASIDIERDGSEWNSWGAAAFMTDAAEHEIFVGSAGTAARFLPGILAARRGPTILRGSEQLTSRPIAPLVAALRALGADVEALGDGQRLPLRIAGGSLHGGAVSMTGTESSQYISGVLMAAPLADRPVEIAVEGAIVQQDYVAITIATMAKFSVAVDHDAGFTRFRVEPQTYRGCKLALEADASTASYFFALAAVTGGHVTVTNLGTGTTQPDYGFLTVLERMGCVVDRSDGATSVQGPALLAGGFEVDMKPMSDTALTLAAIAPFADAPIHIHNIAHIRKHESDRIAVACGILRQIGIETEERPDGLTVHPGEPRHAVIDPRDDHRVAMAFALTGLKGAGVTITNPSCISKTCPDYFDMLKAAGVFIL